MSISTRKGDDGLTSLIYGKRVSKTHPRVEAYGAVDELNSTLGLCRAHCEGLPNREFILATQHELVALMGELATDNDDQERFLKQASKVLTQDDLQRMDSAVARMEAVEDGFRGWIYPGENISHAFFDVARTTCRRAERKCLLLQGEGGIVRPLIIQYLNRLADVLWLMGREASSAI
ncbi:MAG: cob(I)yrinic acid a,c-diamide adenosyltransferase [Puniceicoccales bacterium]